MSTAASTSSQAKQLRPVILVTGANAGVGFGICQRLLVQLSSPTPSDTLPNHPQLYSDPTIQPTPTPFSAADGCTIILACRNPIKAHKARQQLQQLLGQRLQSPLRLQLREPPQLQQSNYSARRCGPFDFIECYRDFSTASYRASLSPLNSRYSVSSSY